MNPCGGSHWAPRFLEEWIVTPEFAVHIVRQALIAAFWLCAPLLVMGFVVSIIVNLIQIATSLQDASFSTIPRLGAFMLGLMLMLPWMLKKITAYAITLFGDLGRYAQ